MPDRIEADTAQLRRRGVAQKTRDIGMRCLMECDGKQQRQQPDGGGVDQVHCSGDRPKFDVTDSIRPAADSQACSCGTIQARLSPVKATQRQIRAMSALPPIADTKWLC